MARCPLHDLPIRENACEECVVIALEEIKNNSLGIK